jgi:hypothetical protein
MAYAPLILKRQEGGPLASRFARMGLGASKEKQCALRREKLLARASSAEKGLEQSPCLRQKRERFLLIFLYLSCNRGWEGRGLMPDGARPALYGMEDVC